MRISDWSSDVCSSDLLTSTDSETFWALTGGGGGTRVVINERTSLSLPALLRALEILTGVFAMTPMIYYRRTAEGKERSEEHTSELQSLLRISYAVFCLKKKKQRTPLTNRPYGTPRLHTHTQYTKST